MTTTFSRSRRNNRSRTAPRLLELLEARTLLSAAIQISGNGAIIANQDITPSILDFTDMGPMSTTFNSAIGRVSRSFVITDTGDANLSLTAVKGKLISITGANKGDFVVSLNAAASIATGLQTGFTITFIPKGAGLRKATVTILSNDPLAPAFTFNIQATGVKTLKPVNGLQVATTVKGLGLGAINGTALTINYTGFLLTSKFESSTDIGGAPVLLTLGVSPVIPGWTQGLLGIKAGETRLLVMPQQLGYDTSSHGNVPANSPLIYLVTASTMANPVALITGNAIPIAFNEKTPIALDGTFLGATPAGSLAPLTFTYKISNGSDGTVVFPKSPVVILATKSAANFSTTDITIDPTSTFATFTVTYTPTKPGTQTAIVHVRTSDPLHPDFTFTVAGTTTAFLDLSPVAVGTINYPVSGNIVSGASTKFKVPLTITNFGNSAVPGATPPISINFYLHDTVHLTDTLISAQSVTNLRGTGPGKAKHVVLSVAVPGTIPTGSYQLLVKVNENTVPVETDYTNNNLLTPQVVNVTQGFFNVNGLLSTSTFPISIAAGLPLAGKLTILVNNAGNLTLPAGQKFTLQIMAHSDADVDTLIGTSTITLSSWVPAKIMPFAVNATLLGGLASGHYELQGVLTPVAPLTESSTLDNRVTLTGIGGVLDLTVI